MVMPSYDAFLSKTGILGSNRNYTPRSLPCITNQALFCSLMIHYSDAGVFDTTANKWQVFNANSFPIKPALYTETKQLDPSFPKSNYTETDLPRAGFDFKLKSNVSFMTLAASQELYIRLSQAGRFWYTALRGLGYSCDPFDIRPVSILPLWAFARAYYDLYYPKRFNPWHSSTYYNAINRHYNGFTIGQSSGGLLYDMVEKWDSLTSMFGTSYSFDFFANVDDNLATAATSNPLS